MKNLASSVLSSGLQGGYFIYLFNYFFLVRSIDFRTDIADAAADSSLVSVQNFIYQFYYELQIENFREGFIFAKFRENKAIGKGEITRLFTDVGKSSVRNKPENSTCRAGNLKTNTTCPPQS